MTTPAIPSSAMKMTLSATSCRIKAGELFGRSEPPSRVGRLDVFRFGLAADLLDARRRPADIDLLARVDVHEDGVNCFTGAHGPHGYCSGNRSVVNDHPVARRAAKAEVPLANGFPAPWPGRTRAP
jgi:hypothetical protein